MTEPETHYCDRCGEPWPIGWLPASNAGSVYVKRRPLPGRRCAVCGGTKVVDVNGDRISLRDLT